MTEHAGPPPKYLSWFNADGHPDCPREPDAVLAVAEKGDYRVRPEAKGGFFTEFRARGTSTWERMPGGPHKKAYTAGLHCSAVEYGQVPTSPPMPPPPAPAQPPPPPAVDMRKLSAVERLRLQREQAAR